jgi:hypothetical protein
MTGGEDCHREDVRGKRRKSRAIQSTGHLKAAMDQTQIRKGVGRPKHDTC